MVLHSSAASDSKTHREIFLAIPSFPFLNPHFASSKLEMNLLEQSGYGYQSPAFKLPLRAEHIMARYRPIAPKPVIPKKEKEGGMSSPDAKPVTAAIAAPSKAKRVRKRGSETGSQQKGQKKICKGSKDEPSSGLAPKMGYDIGPVDIESDPAFMDRAAGHGYGLHLHPICAGKLLAPKSTQGVSGLCQEKISGANLWMPGAGFAVKSYGEGQESETRTDVVTLPLLPETPSNSPCESSITSCSSEGSSRVIEDEDEESLTRLCLSAGRSYEPRKEAKEVRRNVCFDRSPSSSSSGDSVTMGTLEKAYLSSPDPILLTDEQNRILWSNLAFKKISERINARMEAGAWENLGHPIALSSFWLHTPHIRVTVWGFLNRKGALRDGEIRDTANSQKIILPSVCHQVFAPQPLRPVGSAISMEEIIECSSNVSPFPTVQCAEALKHDLEQSSVPSIISDSENRVRFVNTAYKQLVGCSWLGSTARCLDLRFCKDVMVRNWQVPFHLVSCHCKTRVEWVSGNKPCSISLHAQISRFHDVEFGPLFVWRFNSPAATDVSSHGSV